MAKKQPAVRNPLTVIAIFSGLAEVSVTVGLKLVDKDVQSIFIWFVILFPVLLVLLFFLTLNFNREVLYAPSDFRDEENFFRRFSGFQAEEAKQKLDQGAQEIAAQVTPASPPGILPPPVNAVENPQAFYLYVEGLLLYAIAQKYQSEVQREVIYGAADSRLVFDGILRSDSRISLVEAKYLRTGSFARDVFDGFLFRVRRVYEDLSDSQRRIFSAVIAVATNLKLSETGSMRQVIENIARDYPFRVEVTIYNLDELEKNQKKS